MVRTLLRMLLGLVGLGAIAALVFNLFSQNSQLTDPQIFDPQKLETASASGALVPLSSVLPMDIAKACVLGPYFSFELAQSADLDPELTAQMEQSDVGEGYVRIAMFDDQTKILTESDLPRGRGPVRIALDGIPLGVCRAAETLMIGVVKHEGFMMVQFSE